MSGSLAYANTAGACSRAQGNQRQARRAERDEGREVRHNTGVRARPCPDTRARGRRMARSSH